MEEDVEGLDANTFDLGEYPLGDALVLNGRELALGGADELVDKISGRDQFAIGIEHRSGHAFWRMQVKSGAVVAPFLEKPKEIPEPLIQTLNTLTYLSADRIGPRETYPASSTTQQSGIGARGEYMPWFVYEHAGLTIPEPMCLPDSPPTLCGYPPVLQLTSTVPQMLDTG